MKKINLLPLLIFFSLFCSIVSAYPIISDIDIDPSDPWVNEDVIIDWKCYDNETVNITNVGIRLDTPSTSTELEYTTLGFNGIEGNYSVVLDSEYTGEKGEFNVTFSCENNNTDVDITWRVFNVSELTGSFNVPSLAYIGDLIDIDVALRKDDTLLPENAIFEVYLNGDQKTIEEEYYNETENWWTVKVNTPSITGIFNLDVIAKYDRTKTINNSTIEIKQPLEFELISIDNTWILPDDVITLIFNALFKGNTIDLEEEYLNIKIGSEICSIQSISQVGNYSYVEIVAPNVSAGKQNLNITFSYMDFVKDVSEEIEYVLSISGRILNSDDEAVNTELRFKNDEIDETFVTESNGSYSGRLPIGDYDLELTFPNSKLFLYDVTIDEFNDSIKFDNTTTEISIEGVDVVENFVYEIELTYSDVYLEMEYDDEGIFDEDNIVIYKCENWNFDEVTCSGDWGLIEPEIDKGENLVKINTTALSAFLIGYKREMLLEFSLDKDEYFLKDTIKITGIVEDNDESSISDADIKMSISDTSITASTKTDSNGEFSLEFEGPENEGTYTVSVTAEISSLGSVSKSTTIKMLKKESLSLEIPGDIQVKEGQSLTTEVLIKNTGKIDLSDLTLSLTGIPEEYYTLSTTQIDQLTIDEEKKIPITFIIPVNASEESYTGKFNVTYDDTYLEKEFTLTILKREKNETLSNVTSRGFQFPSIGIPIGYFTLPSEGFTILSISLFAIFTFSTSIWLKKRKFNLKSERDQVKNLLLDIKREMNRKPGRIEWLKKETTKNN